MRPPTLEHDLRRLSVLTDGIIYTLRGRHKLQRHLEHDDLHNEGMLAGWQALQTYDPGRGVERDSYVAAKIAIGLYDYQRTQARVHGYSRDIGRYATIGSLNDRVPATGDRITVGDLLADPVDVAHEATNRAEAHRLLTVVARMDPRKPRVTRYKAIVAGYLLELNQREIGDTLGISESRISQLSDRLRDHMQATA